MTISKKSAEELLYKSIFYGTIGVFALIYIVSGKQKIDDIFIFLAFAFAIFLIIKGLWHFIEIKECKQESEYKFDIKNNILYFNKNKFDLQNSYLFFHLNECGDNISVALYQEKRDKIITIFSKIIFNRNELLEFLKLIKPYRKFNAFPWDKFNTNKTLYVCKDGFIIDGREIFYNEVKKMDWETKFNHNMTAKTRIVTLYIDLKNGENIMEIFYNAKWLIYAKIFYIHMRVNNEKIDTATGHKKIAKEFNKILQELDKNGCESIW